MLRLLLIYGFAVFSLSCIENTTESRAVGYGPPMMLVGVAKVEVTPTEPVVLAGYGGRKRPFQEIDTKLWARALVIGERSPFVFIVIDNCGVPENVTERLALRLENQQIAKSNLLVAATHTHNAPSLSGYAPIVWAGRTSKSQDRAVEAYTSFVIDQMEAAVVQALKNREAMTLEWGAGRVTFGGNRRVLDKSRWQGFGLQRDGPVDHSLPVLAGRDPDGKVRFVWANYACHCTTVGSRNAVGGDWAGYANEWIEKSFDGATSLMSIGCGADVGPQPTGTLELAEKHGRSIAAEVREVLAGETKVLRSSPSMVSELIQIPLETPPSREHWEKLLNETSGFDYQLAKSMLKRIDQDGGLNDSVDYPISVCRFGDELAIVFLGGEVVVDYSLRLSSELDWRRLWITAWTNGMPGYIPSRRILAEGGYEAEFSQVYYNHPTHYRGEIEKIVVEAVKRMAGPRFKNSGVKPPRSMHRTRPTFRWVPDHQKQAFSQLAAQVARHQVQSDRMLVDKLRQELATASAGISDGGGRGGRRDHWYDFAGDSVERVFIRQWERGDALRWEVPDRDVQTIGKRHQDAGKRVFCFTGGLGWLTEAETEGFSLEVNGSSKLKFDVTREMTQWSSQDGKLEMIYLPTWTSDLDSGGFFIVCCNELESDKHRDVSVEVRSLGEASKRWFAIDTIQDMPARLEKLRTAVQIVAD
ncbi:neutral/alkaline non-lysosomal ceramidase N-terminal domain-containing protein [bacterium]|nr:neutral/alkaline non-lysosomal ceramidase N-terminal domain-containing protein [bacterium]